MKKLLFAAAIAALALVSCQKAEVQYVPDTNSPVRFEVRNIGTYSVKSEAIEEVDEEIGVFAGAPINRNNVLYKVAAGKTLTTEAAAMYWGATQTDPTPFAAMYPYDSKVTNGIVAYDITTFAHANKFMTAYVSTPKGEAVVLPFKHPFAKLVVTVNTNNLENDSVKEVKIGNITQTGSMNLLANTVTPGSKVADPVVSEVVNGKYVVIMYPEETNPIIYVNTYAGDTYAFQLEAAHTFVAGEVATASVAVTGGAGDAGQGGQGAPATVGSFTVTEWAAETSAGSTAVDNTNTTVNEDWWYLLGSVNGTVWSKAFALTATAENQLSITFDYNVPANASDEGFKLVKVAKSGVAAFVADLSTWGTAVKQEAGANDSAPVITPGTEYNAWGKPDGNLKLSEAGNYTLTFAPEGYKVNVTKN
ncbi:MAG: fimbrillin family protein [Bacteroidales bacterium]|nr:fimbrillin family protein [Bacteroidales bacterium]